MIAHQVLISAGRHQPITGKVVCTGNQTRSNSLLRISILTAAGLFGVSSSAEAATSIFWSDNEPGVSTLVRPQPKRRLKAHRTPVAKLEKPIAKPQGPLIISVSIEQQKLKVYDANGLFAETPISTGTRSHPTPMGVFSIIQKNKFHRSNLYSGAPMPYMQRITWSGVAMHAGALPGYPASHGCIRMPMAFAVKMWGWTRMGARVIVTPGEITPASFSHPLLIAKKPEPVTETPVSGLTPKPETARAKSDRASAVEPPAKPSGGSGHPELRSSIMLDSPKVEPANSAVQRDQVRTADASAALIDRAATLTDAGSGDATTLARPVVAEAATATKADDPVAEAASAPKPDAAEATDAAIATSDDKSSDSPTIAATAPKAEEKANDKADDKPIMSSADTSASTKDVAMPGSDGAAATGVTNAFPDPRKDQTRASDADKPAAKPDPAVAPAPKRSGQIAVFVSRKDNKIYVRQNLAPLFDAPVAIAPSDRPLGTHIFTAQADKDDSFRWSAVSLPTTARQADLRDGDERTSRRRKAAGAVETKPVPLPNSAAEALDRLTIPADAMARIADALSTGGSLVVSDQGIAAGETGEGTDFIIRLR